MLEFWSVDNFAFTGMGYSMSYIELMGTIFYLGSVQLMTQENIWTWPVGIGSVILFMSLFYQIHLYSDCLEQVYFLLISLYGWWRWRTPSAGGDRSLVIPDSSRRQRIAIAGITFGIAIATGAFMSRIHLVLPNLFPVPASFPYLDALTTIMSFTAMALMAQKYIESWYYWIMVDAIGIGLYYAKEVKLITVLYIILLFMAINGLRQWRKAARNHSR